MASENPPPTSFSASRRWAIFFSVVISIIAAFALVVMLNYLGARYYKRFVWSRQTDIQLSPQTVSRPALHHQSGLGRGVLRQDGQALLVWLRQGAGLEEYHLDQSQNFRSDGGLPGGRRSCPAGQGHQRARSTEDKNLVIFNCQGRRKIVAEALLADNSWDAVPNDKAIEYKKSLKAFEGEKWFSAALLSVTSTKPFTACFFGRRRRDTLWSDATSDDGYQKFGQVLEEKTTFSA